MNLALTIIHVVISLVLVVVVLMQHGKQQGLSGAIAGGAETFFGKNKGRTIDAMLKKFTAVLAVLFVASSIALTVISVNQNKSTATETQPTEQTEQAESADGSAAQQQVSLDENGNLVDANGNVVMTADQVKQQQEAAASQDAASGDNNVENATAENANNANNADNADENNADSQDKPAE